MTKPIKPSEISKIKSANIPSFVIEAFNEVIAKNFGTRSAKILVGEVIEKIISNSPNMISRADIFNNNWLEIDDMYREAGWEVDFDRPGYNESYEANWTFTKK